MNTNGDFKTIECSFEEGVARLTFNRPDKLNTFTSQMHTEIREVLSRVQQSADVRCLVISGNGRGFCAGQDLADLDLNALGEVVDTQYNPLLRTLTQLNIPVIASVNGVAAGAGANLALACDIVLAARSAKFIQSSACRDHSAGPPISESGHDRSRLHENAAAFLPDSHSGRSIESGERLSGRSQQNR